LQSCETIGTKIYDEIRTDCLTNNIVQVHGKVDLIFGLPSKLTVDCPMVVHGMEIEWNKEETKIPGKPDRLYQEFRYGKEYLFDISE
jgi:hypothetical protein